MIGNEALNRVALNCVPRSRKSLGIAFSVLDRCLRMKLLQRVCCFLVLCASMHTLSAQDSSFQKALYFDLGGSGGAFSFNYEEPWASAGNWQVSWSAGLSVFPIDVNNGVVLVIPTIAHAYYGSGAHKLELGMGHALSITTKASGFSMITPLIGYRYQSPQTTVHPWFYRVTYTPIVSYLLQFQYQHWLGLSVGYQW